MKANQTYIERSSYHWALYLRVNESRCEGTPPQYCGMALHDPSS
jgi:hypothetical protein